MELKVYLQVLLKKWWIVVPTFLITLTAGIYLTYTATPIYRATATYLVSPNASEDTRVFLSTLEALGRRNEIATTFTEVASSRLIKRAAAEALSLDSISGYGISGNLRAGTNILEFTVEGPSPTIARDLANTVAVETEEYVKQLQDIYTLLPLDLATEPVNPIRPNKSRNLVLVSVLGIVLGAGLAFLSTYLEAPVAWVDDINIIDSQTGVYNERYFLRRLNTEMIRAKRNRYALSIALMRVDNLGLLKGHNAHKIRTDLLHQMASLISQHLREEDILAHLQGDTFVFLLPDMGGENAKAIMEYLQTRISWAPFQSAVADVKLNLKGIFGVVSYNYDGTSRNDLVAQVDRALQLAEASETSGVYLLDSSIVNNHNA